ncbi:hypothetical protein E2562_000113 [Oryza meyeriana var. granulata]|uniref:Integrase catalytic domain-containing protein n=1 Tax=Oryza meyeriana var. granulata TaxID=110450 RepID=A0A6G1DBW6_9ORYZ|nr:hypothetical protein E2562_000113 [Oryza meyeriana var. granulata]
MSLPLPASTAPPPDPNVSVPIPSAPIPQTSLPAGSLPLAAGASSSAVGVMTNEQLTAAVLDLGRMMAGVHAFLLGPQPGVAPTHPQPQLPPAPNPPQPPAPDPQQRLPSPALGAVYPYGMPPDSTAHTTAPAPGVPPGGVPIQEIQFPHSPSPLPPWLPNVAPPVYSSAPARPSVQSTPPITAGFGHGGVPASGTLYGGHVGLVFTALRAHGLFLKRSKCSFGALSVAYLGHVISADGVAMDSDKVAAVASWPLPRSPRGRNKTPTTQPAGLLQPLDVPSQVWADISMDFIEGLPKVHGKSVVLTVVDRFSKYAHFIALSHPYTAASVARAFFDGIVRLHGFPSSIVSDRDPVFTSNLWRDLFKCAD